MKNPYSLFLLLLMIFFAFIMIVSTVVGAPIVAIGFAILVAIIASGFTTVGVSTEKDPEVGLITVFGKNTKYKVNGPTLLFHPFGLNILDVVRIKMVLKERTYHLKDLMCLNGFIDAEITLGQLADDTDGNTLFAHKKAGGVEEIFNLLDDISRAALQEVARVKTTEDMIANATHHMIDVMCIATGSARNDLVAANDARYLGSKYPKATLKCTDTPRVIEEKQRAAAANLISLTVQGRIQLLEAHNAYLVRNNQPPEPIPTFDIIRRDIIEEEAYAKGNAQIIKSGGRTVNLNTVSGGNAR